MHQVLDDFIKQCGNSAEIKRGLAVKQDLEGKPRVQIADILSVHPAFVSKWRLIYDEFGVNGLYSTHQGGAPRSFLTGEQRKQTLTHIGLQTIFGPKDLQLYLEKAFDVRFKSMQSYYRLLHEAGMSWHKSQKTNPRRDKAKILEKRQELKKKFRYRRQSIKNRKTIVLFQDECHLKHGDAEGYVWGKKGERISVPMMNERHSQTFYGALDLVSMEFHLKEYDWANMVNTVDYLQWLINKYPLAKRIIIVWDGASFHKGELVKQFLQKVNGGLKESKWKLHCLLFAPNAPEQNPVEDCWLQAKNFVRRHILETPTFKDVVKCFNRAFNELDFDFGKLSWYY